MITNTSLEYKGDLYPSKIVSFEHEGDSIFFNTDNKVILKVTILRDSLIRFRFTTKGYFSNDFSYAIDKTQLHGYNFLELTEEETYFQIRTSKVKCKIQKADLRLSIYDLNDLLILEDELGFHWEESYEYGGNIVKMSKSSKDGECFYGLGDKATQMNLKGKRLENFATDQYAYQKDQEPLYKVVPFYIGLHNKQSYGIFFDNTFRTFFDFCQERRNVSSFWAEGGEMNYYFIYGPQMQDVVTTYTDLTGKPELPPLWVLGYHQCKWSYYPESKVKEITSKFRELKIPCDAIYLDIDYMEGFRCFTWNKNYFPDPKRMVAELAEDGFKTIVIIDPGIKIDKDYWVYQEALEKDYFCKRADGPYMKGKVWPGECNFPDYTNPVVREWWAGLFKELISDIGVKGVWNDMNEPAVMEVPNKTFPMDVRHVYDGNPCSHRKAHNIYGTQMARATYHGVKRFTYPKRPFVITRSAYSGAQRYTSSWTGDNVATWEHLWIANIQVQRMSISGMGFTGSDIGGFAEQPTGELYARWIQLGVFHPFCRTHSSGDHGNQEPWAFDEEVINITRKFVSLRYQLLPYLYTMFWQYIEEGIPMLKPLVYYDQEDTQTHYRNDEFIFGNQILVCPILEPNAVGRRMYIPRGEWYNYWTNEFSTGGREVWIDTKFDEIPVFVKAGAIIPKYPVQQYVGELEFDELTLDLYFKNGKEKSVVYEDAQDGYDYKKGRYSFLSFRTIGKEKELIVQLHKEGKYHTPYSKYKINLIGLPFKVTEIEIDNEKIAFDKIAFEENHFLIVDKEFSELHISGE
ncbi:Oligosaccharide 4-alpha-D-glucosyltransferase [Flavobacterium bizetiae]|uniref:Oligosaccharide 4-alpha-D-glucosyltransferase n=1 Tax=Flavobacterium bizetiae TaxID=2704140 RepID=A0A6J4GX63_9FLAO|nr:glycoside hydrolase family 31 protein [Flavobacterium bizetiae]CAA9203492.1 Oligosaccharide 4-alpha-D-glucosyltransferase [Flavobacterium bizetiae]CAD5344806.1 Oligosaccharide 4-alpha-D-glucosyltransferase [Flavobacterium bizetiae]CAD5350894.1 Oligosaccharide 4-alpha-D-glucosyltransferase [Flavobacterium bizetiae]